MRYCQSIPYDQIGRNRNNNYFTVQPFYSSLSSIDQLILHESGYDCIEKTQALYADINRTGVTLVTVRVRGATWHAPITVLPREDVMNVVRLSIYLSAHRCCRDLERVRPFFVYLKLMSMRRQGQKTVGCCYSTHQTEISALLLCRYKSAAKQICGLNKDEFFAAYGKERIRGGRAHMYSPVIATLGRSHNSSKTWHT